MDWLFRRNFWVVNLCFMAIAAAFVALAINSYIALKLSKAIEIAPAKKFSKPVTHDEAARNFSIANDRNLFATKREAVTFKEQETTGEEKPVLSWHDAVLCKSPLRLTGTAVFEDYHQSLAAVIDDGKGDNAEPHSYSINDCSPRTAVISNDITNIMGQSLNKPFLPCNELPYNLKLVRIEMYRVVVLNEAEHRYEYLPLQREGEKQPQAPVKAVVEDEEGGGKGVKKVGASSYELEQGELDRVLSNLAEISTQARVFPAFEGGKSIGFKVVNIKSGSIFEKIGLKNGDIITKVNGYEINSPDKALELFAKLKTSKQFNVDFKRGDKPSSFDYSVVP